MAHARPHPDSRVECLTRLAYELLDAHEDTARLAAGSALDLEWALHLDYLRDLQRVAREQLARATDDCEARR
ncbi:MAG: hypothetical protein JSS99_10310 [Actinobacteria bacterium]|nr:hypothetical protein [Actinomycetota bacterium]